MHSEYRREVVRHRNQHNSAIRAAWNEMTGYQLSDAQVKAPSRTFLDAPTGGLLTESPHLYSANGALTVTLSYVTSVGSEGIEEAVAEVRGLPQRLIMLRDHLLPPGVTETETMPAWDLSINGSLIRYPGYEHPSTTMIANRDEVWRVLNSAADAMIDLEVDHDGIAQPLTIVALDGVPVNLRSTAAMNKGPKAKGAPSIAPKGSLLTATHYLLAPGNRVEFIISSPSASVKVAKLVTRYVDTGPGGDLDPMRPLLDIKLAPKLAATPDASIAGNILPQTTTEAINQRFAGFDTANPTVTRKLYFSSEDRDDDTDFYIVVDGTEPTLYNPHLPPAITTTQGTTEDWIIENRTKE